MLALSRAWVWVRDLLVGASTTSAAAIASDTAGGGSWPCTPLGSMVINMGSQPSSTALPYKYNLFRFHCHTGFKYGAGAVFQ